MLYFLPSTYAQRSFIWPQYQPNGRDAKEGWVEGGGEHETKEEEEEDRGSTLASPPSSPSRSFLSSISNGSYNGEDVAFFIPASDESLPATSSLVSFDISPQARGESDRWDTRAEEAEEGTEGGGKKNVEENKSAREMEIHTVLDILDSNELEQLDWWHVLGMSPPQGLQNERKQEGTRNRLENTRETCPRTPNRRQGFRLSPMPTPRAKIDHMWEILCPFPRGPASPM